MNVGTEKASALFSLLLVGLPSCDERAPCNGVGLNGLIPWRLEAIAVELTEQGASQNTTASSSLASAQLLAIIAKGVESDES